MLTCGRCGRNRVRHVASRWVVGPRGGGSYRDGYLLCDACGLRIPLHGTGSAGSGQESLVDSVSTTPLPTVNAATTPPRPPKATKPASGLGPVKVLVAAFAAVSLVAGGVVLSNDLRQAAGPPIEVAHAGDLAPPATCAAFQAIELPNGVWFCSYRPYPPDGVNSRPCFAHRPDTPAEDRSDRRSDRRADRLEHREDETRAQRIHEFKFRHPLPDVCHSNATTNEEK